jgi:hypothetical protein
LRGTNCVVSVVVDEHDRVEDEVEVLPAHRDDDEVTVTLTVAAGGESDAGRRPGIALESLDVFACARTGATARRKVASVEQPRSR